jgi:hypothetical protein
MLLVLLGKIFLVYGGRVTAIAVLHPLGESIVNGSNNIH